MLAGKSILASVAAGGCLFSIFALVALSIDQPSKRAAVSLASTDSNKLSGISLLHSAKHEAEDLADYFDSIP